MDLNYLYSRHQTALMAAAGAQSIEARATHKRFAALYADRINALRDGLPAGSARAF